MNVLRALWGVKERPVSHEELICQYSDKENLTKDIQMALGHQLVQSIPVRVHDDPQTIHFYRLTEKGKHLVETKMKLDEEIIKLMATCQEKENLVQNLLTKHDLHEEEVMDEVKRHIQLLHDYNEIKDMGQMMLGKLAEIEGVTTKALYEQFHLNLDD